MPRLRLNQTQDRTARRGFTTARLPYQRQGLPLVHGKRQVFDRVHMRHGPAQQSPLNRKTRSQIAHGQDRLVCAGDFLDLLVLVTEQLHRAWHIRAFHFAQLRNRRQKRLGIIVLWVFENLFDGAFFDLFAAEHNDHAVRHLRHDSHVMGNKHDSGSGFALEAIHQGQNFGLNGYIQRRCRLVRNQQPWLACHRHGNHDALAHTAGQFVGVLDQPPLGFRDANFAQQFQCAGLCLGL